LLLVVFDDNYDEFDSLSLKNYKNSSVLDLLLVIIVYVFNSENAHTHTVGKYTSAWAYLYIHMVHAFHIHILADQTHTNKSNMSKL